MKITIEIQRPRWLTPRLIRRSRPLALLLALFIGVPIVLATDWFIDVPATNVHHNDISKIANAGITVGCGVDDVYGIPIYCPDTAVTRAQMASFLARGLGRVAHEPFDTAITQTADGDAATVGDLTISPGVPAGALSGATGFLEAHASISVLTPTIGCPCAYGAGLYDATEGEYLSTEVIYLTVAAGTYGHFTITGAIPVDVVGSHAIEVRVWRATGTGTGAAAFGGLTATYHPFGSTGGATP